jgi:DNA-binding FadR family transcriptional regulator
VLIQGDSLSIIRADVAEIVEACDQGDVGEAREAAAILLSNFDELLARYTAALKAHDIPIPSTKLPDRSVAARRT